MPPFLPPPPAITPPAAYPAGHPLLFLRRVHCNGMRESHRGLGAAVAAMRLLHARRPDRARPRTPSDGEASSPHPLRAALLYVLRHGRFPKA